MIEFYINDKKVDITDSVSITLNGTNEDWTNPSAVKVSYSKTITLEGTQNNNILFSHLYNLNGSNIFNFDTTVRNDAVILNNGVLIDSGYITLDKVSIKNNQYKYDVTFYSSLAQFFYNLKYNNNLDNEEEEKTLADLYYGFEINGVKLTKEEEDSRVLINWTSDYIADSWNELVSSSKQNFKNYSSKNIKHNVTAAPTYSGYYDDFDNDKILSYNPNSTVKNYFGITDEAWNNSKSYAKNWGLFEAPRDLDEWECLDLRSLYQRPAIRMKAVLDAISDPVNNGGFNVEWPEEIKATDGKLPKSLLGNYYNLTWLINDRFTFDDYAATTEYSLTLKSGQLNHGTDSSILFNGEETVDTSVMFNPKAQLALNVNIPYPANLESKLEDYLSLNNMSYTLFDLFGTVRIESYTTNIIEYTVTLDNSQEKRFILTEGKPDIDIEEWRRLYFPDLPEGYFNGAEIVECKLKKNSTVKRYINENKIYLDLANVPNVKDLNIRIRQNVIQSKSDILYGGVNMNVQSSTLSYGNLYVTTRPNRDYPNSDFPYTQLNAFYSDYHKTLFNANAYTLLDNATEYHSILYDTIQSNVQNVNIDKKILFQGSKTPLDYLLNFTKLLNLRFIYDKLNNKIKIVDSTQFYTGNIINIENDIDRSKEITVKPNFWGSKVFKYQIPANDTYLKYLTEKKSGREFLAYNYNTNNFVLNGTNDVFEGFVLNSVSDFCQQSVYYDNWVSTPLLKGTKCTCKIFKGQDLSSEDWVAWWNKTNTVKDPIPKLCLFDNENSTVTDNICLMFLNTAVVFEVTSQGVIVSDNLPIMYELNGAPCHIDKYSNTTQNGIGYASIYDTTTKTIYHNVRYLPYFSPYLFATKQSPSGKWNMSDGLIRLQNNKIYTQPHAICSTHLLKPDYINNNVIYVDGCKFIFDFAWRNNLIDWFDKENKEVTCYVKLDNFKKLVDIMRDFYYFDNALWMLNKVEDFDVLIPKPTKCTFIKVKDVDKYLTKYNPEVEEGAT